MHKAGQSSQMTSHGIDQVSCFSRPDIHGLVGIPADDTRLTNVLLLYQSFYQLTKPGTTAIVSPSFDAHETHPLPLKGRYKPLPYTARGATLLFPSPSFIGLPVLSGRICYFCCAFWSNPGHGTRVACFRNGRRYRCKLENLRGSTNNEGFIDASPRAMLAPIRFTNAAAQQRW